MQYLQDCSIRKDFTTEYANCNLRGVGEYGQLQKPRVATNLESRPSNKPFLCDLSVLLLCFNRI